MTTGESGGEGRRTSSHVQVVQRLGARIVSGEFGAAGGGLPIEPELAAGMGVGRNVLREAVKVLASKGLVEVRRKSGTRVLPRKAWNLLDPDVLAWLDQAGHRLEHSFDLVEFRLIVEPQASFLAAKRATAEERRAIRQAYVDLEACIGHPDRVAGCDLVFHGSILAASHNAILNHLGSLIASLMQRQVLTTTDHDGAFERGLPLHLELTDAIVRGDAAAAETISRRLVLQPYDDLAQRLSLPAATRLAESEVE
jgi:DNA-binding FadR family transcriptional regulator